jgi:hypothetical protein
MRLEVGTFRPAAVAIAAVSATCLVSGIILTLGAWSSYEAYLLRNEILEEYPEAQLSPAEKLALLGSVGMLIERIWWLFPILQGVSGVLFLAAAVGLLAHQRWARLDLELAGWAGLVWFGLSAVGGSLMADVVEASALGAFVPTSLVFCGVFGGVILLSKVDWLRREVHASKAA